MHNWTFKYMDFFEDAIKYIQKEYFSTLNFKKPIRRDPKVSSIIFFNCNKLENAWYYHKNKILIFLTAVIVVIVACFMFGSGKPKADVTVLWLGPDEIPDVLSEKLNNVLSGSIEDINHDGVKKIVFANSDSPMRNFFSLYSGDAQVLILSFSDFMLYCKMDAFRPLEDIVGKSSLNVDQTTEIKISTESDSTEHIYGISLDGNKFFADLGLDMKDTCIAISSTGKEGKMKKNGLKIIEAVLKCK